MERRKRINEWPAVEELSTEETERRNSVIQQIKDNNLDVSLRLYISPFPLLFSLSLPFSPFLSVRFDIKKVPEHLVCPITQQILFDPVFTGDGHTYLSFLSLFQKEP